MIFLKASLVLGFALLLNGSTFASECLKKSLQALAATPGEIPIISRANSLGPRAFVPAGKHTRNINDISELSIGQFNLENLLEVESSRSKAVPLDTTYFVDEATSVILSKSPVIEKPIAKLKALALTIKRADPDILVVQEVGGMVSLDHFSKTYLDGRYKSILIPSRAPPNVPVNDHNIGFLVKQDLPFDIEVQSFKNVRKLNEDSRLFTRDLPVIMIKAQGSDNPLMAIFGTHFKAFNDANDWALRVEQVAMAGKIIKKYSQQNNLPVFLVGDFNFDILKAVEYRVLRERAGLEDAFNLAPADKTVPTERRHTQFSFIGNDRHFTQLDSVSGNKAVQELKLIKSAEIRQHVDQFGTHLALPKYYNQKKDLPSDHAMLKVVIDFKKVRQNTPK